MTVLHDPSRRCSVNVYTTGTASSSESIVCTWSFLKVLKESTSFSKIISVSA